MSYQGQYANICSDNSTLYIPEIALAKVHKERNKNTTHVLFPIVKIFK